MSTSRHTLFHGLALLAASVLPTWFGLTGPLYAWAAGVLGFFFALSGWMFIREKSVLGARRLFVASVIYLPLLLIFMVLDRAHHAAPLDSPAVVLNQGGSSSAGESASVPSVRAAF